METVVSFLEKVGGAPRMSADQLAQAFDAANLETEHRSALLAHDGNSLARMLDGRQDMKALIWIDDAPDLVSLLKGREDMKALVWIDDGNTPIR